MRRSGNQVSGPLDQHFRLHPRPQLSAFRPQCSEARGGTRHAVSSLAGDPFSQVVGPRGWSKGGWSKACIAIKALSKAINDPSTAVVALDQLHRLLRVVGRRHLHDDVIMDSLGTPRVIFRTPGWDDFVQLFCREIRLDGAENYQVARRLRAMLENLVQSLFEARHAALL